MPASSPHNCAPHGWPEDGAGTDLGWGASCCQRSCHCPIWRINWVRFGRVVLYLLLRCRNSFSVACRHLCWRQVRRILSPVLKISDIWRKWLMKTRLWKPHLRGKKRTGIRAFPGGWRRLRCALCRQVYHVPPMAMGSRTCPAVRWHHSITCPWSGSCRWEELAELKSRLLYLYFLFPPLWWGVMLPAPRLWAHSGQCPMEVVPGSFLIWFGLFFFPWHFSTH